MDYLPFAAVLLLAPISALVWWYRVRIAFEGSKPVGIYERIQGILAKQAHPMEDDVRSAVERELDAEFRVAMTERALDTSSVRLALRDDELLEVVPVVVHADGREEALSAFEATLMRKAAGKAA